MDMDIQVNKLLFIDNSLLTKAKLVDEIITELSSIEVNKH